MILFGAGVRKKDLHSLRTNKGRIQDLDAPLVDFDALFLNIPLNPTGLLNLNLL